MAPKGSFRLASGHGWWGREVTLVQHRGHLARAINDEEVNVANEQDVAADATTQ